MIELLIMLAAIPFILFLLGVLLFGGATAVVAAIIAFAALVAKTSERKIR